MFRLTYGADITPQFLALLTKVNEQTGSALQPGRWAVNSLPFCKTNTLVRIPYVLTHILF